MAHSPLIGRLIEELRRLPGIGPKSAQRIAFHILERDRDCGRRLGQSLLDAVSGVGRCRDCRSLSESELCDICANPKRDRAQLCVVENPTDVVALEQATGYRGLYFVLGGRLSPLDGIGPKELGLDELEQRLAGGELNEVILATNPTVEGEATAHFISEMAKELGIKATRIAHGVPLGGELEYVDGGTLSHAFHGRRDL